MYDAPAAAHRSGTAPASRTDRRAGRAAKTLTGSSSLPTKPVATASGGDSADSGAARKAARKAEREAAYQQRMREERKLQAARALKRRESACTCQRAFAFDLREYNSRILKFLNSGDKTLKLRANPVASQRLQIKTLAGLYGLKVVNRANGMREGIAVVVWNGTTLISLISVWCCGGVWFFVMIR